MTPDTGEVKQGRLRRFLGILRVRGEYGKGLLLTRRFYVVVGLGVVGLMAAGGGFTLYTSTPSFCGTCHIMEPYVESWKQSSHKDVNCIKCHFAPGFENAIRAKLLATRYVAATIAGVHVSKPTAEIDDASCLREGCHETRLINGKVTFKGKFTFDHGLHLGNLRRGKQLRCTSCHSQIVQGSHIRVTESVCFTCHFKGHVHDRMIEPIAGCTACHQPPTKPIQLAGGQQTFQHQPYLDRKVPCWKCHFDSVQGTGDVSKQVCIECHNEPAKLERYSDSAFMHNWHVTQRKVECFHCHSEIRHGLHPEPFQHDMSCSVCHSPGHSLQAKMLAGQGAKSVPAMPSQMFRANVDCVACHEVPALGIGTHPTEMTTFKATDQACADCHGAAYKNMLAQWKQMLAEAVAESQAALAGAEKAYQKRPDGDPQNGKAKALFDVARENLEFVRRANGVHNLEYALAILNRVTTDSKEVVRLIGPAAGPQVSAVKPEGSP